MAQASTKKPADGPAAADNAEPKRLGLNALDRIGNTPLLRLDRIARDVADAEILGKAEWYNPGGSVKDRAASRIVLEAQRSGKLSPGKSCSTRPAAIPGLPMP
jgi:cysteine synthase B